MWHGTAPKYTGTFVSSLTEREFIPMYEIHNFNTVYTLLSGLLTFKFYETGVGNGSRDA
jgi:hypothetical protein